MSINIIIYSPKVNVRSIQNTFQTKIHMAYEDKTSLKRLSEKSVYIFVQPNSEREQIIIQLGFNYFINKITVQCPVS